MFLGGVGRYQCVFLLEASVDNPFLCLFQLLKVATIPWLVVTPFKLVFSHILLDSYSSAFYKDCCAPLGPYR